MAIFTHRANRVTGMSGLDTESMVRQIMQAESSRLHRVQRNRTRLEWRQEAYQGVTARLNAFHRRFLDNVSPATNIRSRSAWANFNTTITSGGTASNAVSITAGGDAVPGTHRLQVLQLAQRHTVTGDASLIKNSIDSREAFNLDDLASAFQRVRTAAEVIPPPAIAPTFSFNLSLNGTSRAIEITRDDIASVSGPLDTAANIATHLPGLLQSKVDAAFGAGRILVGFDNNASGTPPTGGLSFQPVGNGHTLTISENRALPASTQQGTAIHMTGGSFDSTSFVNSILGPSGGTAPGPFSINVNGTDIEIDFTGVARNVPAIMQRINSTLAGNGISASASLDTSTGIITFSTNGITREDITIGAGTMTSTYDLLSRLGFASAPLFTLEKTSALSFLNISNGDRNIFSNTDNAMEVLDLPASAWGPVMIPNPGTPPPATVPDPSGRQQFVMNINGTNITIFSDDTMLDLERRINNSGAGVTFSYNALSRAFTLQSNREGEINTMNFGAAGSNANLFLNALGITNTTQAGQDSVFVLNGVQTSRESNSFGHEGVTFRLNQVTGTVVTANTPGAIQMAGGPSMSVVGHMVGGNWNNNFAAPPANGLWMTNHGVDQSSPPLDAINIGGTWVILADVNNPAHTVNGVWVVPGTGPGSSSVSGTWTHADAVETAPNSGVWVIPGNEVVIELQRDIEPTLNLIRDFVEAYNELRTSINDMIHERRARSMGAFFEPLTDEERRNMSETEIQRWEAQARTGLMQRNSLLTRIVNQMRDQLFQGVVLADGSVMSLDRIGIEPSSIAADRGILIIDEERLRAALESPQADSITEMFTQIERRDPDTNAVVRGTMGLGDRLHRIVNEATGLFTGRGTLTERAGGSSLTDPNNELGRQIRREEDRIANITRQLQRREEALYRMFGRLEIALAQSDSQMNFMMQMFWQG